MTEELRKRMASLRSIAPKLNQATDSAAAVISKLEAFLGELHVGIEGRAEAYDARADPDADEERPQTIRSRMAYGRINDKFAIHVVRETWTKVVISISWRENDPNAKPEFVSEERVAWSSVGRQEKLKAFATIEELLDSIEGNAKEVEEKANEASGKLNEMLKTLDEPIEGDHDAANEDGFDLSDKRPRVYRPERPASHPAKDHECDHGFYKVTRGTRLIFAYDAVYYPTAKSVASDLTLRITKQKERETEPATLLGEGDMKADFAIWRDDRLVAAIREESNGRLKTVVFEVSDESIVVTPRPGWPSRAEWIADGSDQVVLR